MNDTNAHKAIDVIVCNYSEGIPSVAKNARCYVISANPGNGGERVYLLARSRSGRWIHKWERRDRLKNFRLLKLQPESLEYEKLFLSGGEFPGDYGISMLTMLRTASPQRLGPDAEAKE